METRIRIRHDVLSDKLRQSRLTQNAWARRLGLSRGHLSQLIHGIRPFPSEETRKKLLDGLDLSFEELFEILPSSGTGGETVRNSPVFSQTATMSGALFEGPSFSGRVLFVQTFFQNLRVAFRMLLKKPGFTLTCLLTLSLGLGANIAMFSIVDGVLLRPLPYPQPEQLVSISTEWNDLAGGSLNPWEYFDLGERTSSFQDLGLYRLVDINLSDGLGEIERVQGVRASASLFQVLGIRPIRGREMRAQETFAGAQPVALLSDRLWKRRFGGDPGIVGRALRILNQSYRVIGIMPPGFAFPSSETELWVSYGIDRNRPGSRGARADSLLARLKPDVTLQQAQAEMETLSEQLVQEFPRNYPAAARFRFFGVPYGDTITGSVRPALLILLGAVGMVLLIACVNLTNLLLVRLKSREKEIAIRSALGAGRPRIVGQILTESLLICLLGGIGAAVTAWGVFRLLSWFFPKSLPRLEEVGLDINVAIFSLGLILLVTLAIGLLPALQASGLGNLRRLREGGRNPTSGGRFKTRASLVVSEVALAVVVLVAAGLLLRSLEKLLQVDVGFEPERVLTTQITLPATKYPDHERRSLFYRDLIREISAQPGILSAAAVNVLPLSGENTDLAIVAGGYVPPDPDAPDFVEYRVVSPAYFETLGIPLREGRTFSDQDRTGSVPVAIVSESLARRYWGDESALGKRVLPGGPGSSDAWHTVVGVVGDIYDRGARHGAVPIWYRSLYQDSWRNSGLVVRTHSPPDQAEGLIRLALREVDPQIPSDNTRASTEMVSASVVQERFNATLLVLFGGLALLLAGIGIFGVISYSVSQRTREIGVRMAMGASRSQVLHQALDEGVRLMVLGLMIGIALALAITRILGSLLFGISSWDPLTYFAMGSLLLLTGFAACWGPAARATRVDPIVALRDE